MQKLESKYIRLYVQSVNSITDFVILPLKVEMVYLINNKRSVQAGVDYTKIGLIRRTNSNPTFVISDEQPSHFVGS